MKRFTTYDLFCNMCYCVASGGDSLGLNFQKLCLENRITEYIVTKTEFSGTIELSGNEAFTMSFIDFLMP